jgi:hypothetical protein
MNNNVKKVGALALFFLIAVPLALLGTCTLSSPLWSGLDPSWAYIAVPVGCLVCGLAWLAGRKAVAMLRRPAKVKDSV